jgi:hypothetical protein
MGRNSLSQQRKRKDRERRVRQEKLDEDRRRLDEERRKEYARSYPGFDFRPNNADPEFVELVRGAVAGINFEDDTAFKPWETRYYRLVKSQGALNAYEVIRKDFLNQGNADPRLLRYHLALKLGDLIFDRIPRAELERFVPFNNVDISPTGGRSIGVYFKALLRAKGERGTAYYSPLKPSIDVDGRPKVVAFSKHAIDQICKRINDRWRTYAGLGEVFGFLGACIYFERCDLYAGQLGFTFFDDCSDDMYWKHCYVKEVLGVGSLDPQGGKAHYRVGYCPAVIEGDFIKATTLLFPGYRSTPEYGAILRHATSAEEERQLLEMTEELDAQHLLESQDLSLIKWFHDHGVPQVVQLDQPVFVHGFGCRS